MNWFKRFWHCLSDDFCITLMRVVAYCANECCVRSGCFEVRCEVWNRSTETAGLTDVIYEEELCAELRPDNDMIREFISSACGDEEHRGVICVGIIIVFEVTSETILPPFHGLRGYGFIRPVTTLFFVWGFLNFFWIDSNYFAWNVVSVTPACVCCPIVTWTMPDGLVNTFNVYDVDSTSIEYVGNFARIFD